MFDKKKMKSQIIDEIMNDMDDGESEKLKPRLDVMPVVEDHETAAGEMASDSPDVMKEADDDDLKALLKEYMSGNN